MSKAIIFPFCVLSFISVPTQAELQDKNAKEQQVEVMVVTSSRQQQQLKLLAESVAVLTEEDIRKVSPGHPADLLNRVAGVHVNDLGGEGHMTAIRQPISTSGVYLFLEDGLPTRPTGFFNHNGLYEIDIPQSGRVEVTKGPGSALYGSDAIGGIFNILTKATPVSRETELSLESGSDGWNRGLIAVGAPVTEQSAARWDLNWTKSDGFRENAGYDRLSSSLRLDQDWSTATKIKYLASFGKIDQSGVSALNEQDYLQRPETNYYTGDIAFRDVQALRLSAEIRHQWSDYSELMLLPFYRNNKSSLMPSWMLSYDPVTSQTEFYSMGLLAQWSSQLSDQLQWISGLDYDYSPARYSEWQITVQRQNGVYTAYEKTGRLHYDFDADQSSVSPYSQLQWQATAALSLTAGVRYDYFNVDYRDLLPASVPETIGRSSWLRPDNTNLSYQALSPKLGALYQISARQQLYFNHRHAFRVPSVGQVFRPGSTTNSTDLEPVKARNSELGWRLQGQNYSLDLAYYQLDIKDDVVSYIDSNERKVTNAGHTRHQGLEAALVWALTNEWKLGSGFTVTDQKYLDFQYLYSCFPPACAGPVTETRNFSGFDVGKAPEQLANANLSYNPAYLQELQLELEWQKVGAYFTDETNTNSYQGHQLWHLRANYQYSQALRLYARLMNLSDKLYSTYTSNQVGSSAIEYRPGMPRSLFVGINLSF